MGNRCDAVSEAWDNCVGSQTAAEFMRYSPGLTPEEAVAQYVAASGWFTSATEASAIAGLLVAYIEWQLS